MVIVSRNPGINRNRVGPFQGSWRDCRVKRLNRNTVKASGAVVAYYTKSLAHLSRSRMLLWLYFDVMAQCVITRLRFGQCVHALHELDSPRLRKMYRIVW